MTKIIRLIEMNSFVGYDLYMDLSYLFLIILFRLFNWQIQNMIVLLRVAEMKLLHLVFILYIWPH